MFITMSLQLIIGQNYHQIDEISRAFQEYADQSNTINIEFKMLENKSCTLVYNIGGNLLRKR